MRGVAGRGKAQVEGTGISEGAQGTREQEGVSGVWEEKRWRVQYPGSWEGRKPEDADNLKPSVKRCPRGMTKTTGGDEREGSEGKI